MREILNARLPSLLCDQDVNRSADGVSSPGTREMGEVRPCGLKQKPSFDVNSHRLRNSGLRAVTGTLQVS
jgi:hypothetical protein